MIESHPPVVIENSSCNIRAGIVGEASPRCCFPTRIIKVQDSKAIKFLIGSQIEENQNNNQPCYPIQNGYIIDWEAMEQIWRYIFEVQLKISPSNHPILLTEAPRNSKMNQERMTEIMFENFDVPFLHISNQNVLSLYSLGKTTGVILDSGEGTTYCVPIYEGFQLRHQLSRLDIAGSNCTNYMTQLLKEEFLKMYTPFQRNQIAKAIKESLCYVALDPIAEENKYLGNTSHNSSYILPDGNKIQIKEQKYQCPEILFNPNKAGYELPGIHEITYQSISKSDRDIQQQLYNNIVITGGTTLFPGLQERLLKEIENLVQTPSQTRVIVPPNRLNSTWIGGSILSTLTNFKPFWITKHEYEEFGPKIAHIKCF
ncbi:unnamed protein product [Paramecium primaurelia]|uniref:Actin, cytoplasmic n=1 Tax=Paramecium primaurelia TaxID=5886 RepID=A0A8S1JPY0_PARPR|nr:unnamed protein product [Paramecium primaurelia]